MEVRELTGGDADVLVALFAAVLPDSPTAAQALYASLGGDRKPLGDVNYWWELDRDA